MNALARRTAIPKATVSRLVSDSVHGWATTTPRKAALIGAETKETVLTRFRE